LKKRKTNKKELGEPSLLELLEQVEAEMIRLREENQRLTRQTTTIIAEEEKAAKAKRATPPRALGKGLSQLFGGPKRG
jgi:hypothetical protein